MSLPHRDPSYTLDQLREAARLFIESGKDYWEACHKSGISAAIVWTESKEGLVIFTRGEYRSDLLQNIEPFGPITSFGSAQEENKPCTPTN